jgi:hypothetical protein
MRVGGEWAGGRTGVGVTVGVGLGVGVGVHVGVGDWVGVAVGNMVGVSVGVEKVWASRVAGAEATTTPVQAR